MRRARAAALAAIALASCAPTYPIAPRAMTTVPAPAAAPPPAASPARPAGQALRTPIPRPDVNPRDQCGAADLQGLVGRPRTEIPVPLIPGRQRVACTTCPVTEDFDPGRLNFFFDRDTGVIREIRCG